MIVKSISQKSPNAGSRLLGYMTRDAASAKDEKGMPLLFKHNISGNSLQELEAAFRQNENGRIHSPANRVFYYHEILSFAEMDTAHLSEAVLEDLTRKYLTLRAGNGMAVFAHHENTESPHVHILLGATECFSGKALRVTKEEFRHLKEELQQYQVERYPDLSSIVEHGKGRGKDIGDAEFQMKARTKQPSRKDEIKSILADAFERSYSPKEFYKNIEEANLKLYERGSSIGIEDNRNYRLGTLGYDEAKMNELDVRSERLNQLENTVGKEMEFVTDREQIGDVEDEYGDNLKQQQEKENENSG